MAEKFLSQRAYAAHRGVAEQAVAKAIRTGRLSASVETLADGTKRIDVEAADKEWAENTFEGNVRKDGDSIIAEGASESKSSSGVNYAAARAAREAVNLQHANFELQRKMGRFVEVDKVRLEWFEICRTIRNSLLSISDRLAPVVAAETDPSKCHELINEEINKALENLSNANSQR